jgi:hypothetical protein
MFSLIAFTLAFSHGLEPRDPSHRGFVVADGGERALPAGSFDGPHLPGCPDQAGFGYHTSPTLQSTLTRSSQRRVSSRRISQIVTLPTVK